MIERAVLVSADETVTAGATSIAAAAGVGLQVVRPDDVAGWPRVPTVLLDLAQLGAIQRAGLPRRAGVVVLATRPLLAEQWRDCMAIGADQVVVLGQDDAVLVAALDDPGTGPGRLGQGCVVAVIGACGGAGASVFCCALALAVGRAGRPALVADTDPLGPGLDVLLGMDGGTGARWADVAAPAGRLPADALHRALPTVRVGRGRLTVLTHGRGDPRPVDPGTLTAVLDASCDAGDGVIVDLARGIDPVVSAAVTRADLTVVVSPADVRGCFAGARLVARLADCGARLGVVVRGPSPGGIGGDDIAAAWSVPLLARMRPEPQLDRQLDAGRPPGANPRGPLATAADAVVARLIGR